MFGILIGWGVFWLLIWGFVLIVGFSVKDNDWIGAGGFFGLISIAYLIAVCVGRAVM